MTHNLQNSFSGGFATHPPSQGYNNGLPALFEQDGQYPNDHSPQQNSGYHGLQPEDQGYGQLFLNPPQPRRASSAASSQPCLSPVQPSVSSSYYPSPLHISPVVPLRDYLVPPAGPPPAGGPPMSDDGTESFGGSSEPPPDGAFGHFGE